MTDTRKGQNLRMRATEVDLGDEIDGREVVLVRTKHTTLTFTFDDCTTADVHYRKMVHVFRGLEDWAPSGASK